MRTTKALAIIMATTLGIGACSSAQQPEGSIEDENLDNAEADLTVTGPDAIGDVTVIAPPETAPVSGPKQGYRAVPGLSGAVQSGKDSNLAVTVTAEMFGTAGAWLRLKVDGQIAGSPTLFMAKDQGHDDVRSYTFVASGLKEGQHTVEIEWQSATFGVAPQMRDRSLTMHTATASDTGKLVVNSYPANFTVSPNAYGTVPGTVVGIATTDVTPLAITFSADADVSAGRLYAQAVVDGVVVSDVLFAEAGATTHQESHSYTFVATGVKPGKHKIEIRASAEKGKAILFGNTIAVAQAPATSAYGGMAAIGVQVAPTVLTSTAFVPVPSLATTISMTAGASTALIETGGEVLVTGGRLFLRALVDGAPAKPGDVTFLQNESKYRAQSFAFTVDNLTPGRHQIQIEMAVDAGASASLGDRFLRVHHARRSGAAFVKPYLGMRPQQRDFKTLVICFDPLRPNVPPPTKAQIVNHFEGTDGGQSTRGWWTENSGGRAQPGTVQYVGCDTGNMFKAPAIHQGNWYWDNSQYELMWKEALQAADPYVDFHSLDLDGSNSIDADEMQIAIVRPQNDAYGTTRGTSLPLDGIATPLGVNVSDLYLSSYDSQRQTGVGVISHEFSHSQLGALDLYSPCPPETDAGYYSIMTAHWHATDSDPLHKMKSGFVTPDAITIPTWTTQTLQLPAVETGNREVTVLYDPAKADREYFVVENRYGGVAGTDATYDLPLGGTHVVVWHIIEDLATRTTYPTVATNPNCRIPIRFLKAMSSAGETYDLMWADGTPAKIRLTLNAAASQTSSVLFTKLP